MMSPTVKSLIVVLFVLGLTVEWTQAQITSCTYNPDICGCDTDKGPINLKRFGGKTLVTNADDYKFFWNPCKDISKGTITAAAIQQSQDGSLSYDAGTIKQTTSDVNDDGKAEFKLVSADQARTSYVTCTCGSGDTYKHNSESTTGTYYMELVSKACCPGGASAASSGSLSVGSIMLIVFFVVVIVYIIGGVIFQAGVRKAQGREMVPHSTFWTGVPGLISDGFRFVFSCGKSTNYSQI